MSRKEKEEGEALLQADMRKQFEESSLCEEQVEDEECIEDEIIEDEEHE